MGYEFEAGRWECEQLKRLILTCLEPARVALGVPMVITSGFRPPWLNKHIGGASDSRHMYGCAADFITPGMDQAEAFKAIRALELPIDQLILEHPPGGWIHLGVALPGVRPRKEYMIAHNDSSSRTRYDHV